jgi:hypothetical protein
MINPIKRIWVPKKAPEKAQPTEPTATPKARSGTKPTSGRGALFDELPSPDMEEKNSDSIWAAFDSVRAQKIEPK